VSCPSCHEGEVVERKTKRGRVFYGCTRYPECDFSSWKRPVSKPCPSCGGTLALSNKREVQCLACEKVYLREELGIDQE